METDVRSHGGKERAREGDATLPGEATGVRSRDERHEPARGREATRPGEVPPRGWLDVLKRARRGIRDTNGSIIAAGVAFYAFLAVVPALIAVVAIYGLVANPADVKQQITEFMSALPRDAQRLMSNQLASITRKAGSGTRIAALLAIAGALWSASSGMAALNTGLTARPKRAGCSSGACWPWL
jgi:membrane protein